MKSSSFSPGCLPRMGARPLPKSWSEQGRGNYRLVPRMEPPWPVQPPTSPQPISFIWRADSPTGRQTRGELCGQRAPRSARSAGAPPQGPARPSEAVPVASLSGSGGSRGEPQTLDTSPRPSRRLRPQCRSDPDLSWHALPMGMKDRFCFSQLIQKKTSLIKN